MEKKRPINVAIFGIIIAFIMISGCIGPKVELPIDNAKEAINYAKQDEDVKEFIEKWSREFRIAFSTYFDSAKNRWIVMVAPKGNINDVEFHIIIKPDGTIVDKYYPPL